MNGPEFSRFWLEYVAQWPTMLAIAPFVLIGSGVAGHKLAKAILEGKTPLAGAEWILAVGIFVYLTRNW